MKDRLSARIRIRGMVKLAALYPTQVDRLYAGMPMIKQAWWGSDAWDWVSDKAGAAADWARETTGKAIDWATGGTVSRANKMMGDAERAMRSVNGFIDGAKGLIPKLGVGLVSAFLPMMLSRGGAQTPQQAAVAAAQPQQQPPQTNSWGMWYDRGNVSKNNQPIGV